MIHPSYVEMIDKINEENEREEAPLINSRYSVVLATAKRARQLVTGVEAFVETRDKYGKQRKPLSIAVDEFYQDKVHIVSTNAADEATAAEGEEMDLAADAAADAEA